MASRRSMNNSPEMSKRDKKATISLAPLGFEEAVRAAMQTGKAPQAPKKAKAKPKGGK